MKKWFYISLALFILSCKKENVELSPLGYNYAGIGLGNYVIYDVDSIAYDDFFDPVRVDTFRYQLKEVIASDYTDLEGEQAYRIERFKRSSDTLDWVISDVWTSKLTATTYEKVEEDQRIVKLVFPVKDGKSWDGNSMNNASEREFEYSSVHETETYGNLVLDSVLKVSQHENINLIDEEFFEEHFAANVGMVYRKNIDIVKKLNSVSQTYERSSGYDLTLTVSSYGGE